MDDASAEFGCRCGAVRGRVAQARPRAVGRAICYCDDCQAAAHYLGRADLLDARGGSDVVQVAPSRVSFAQGAGNIVGLRLNAKGLHRFHARCCNTPVGSVISVAIPYIGLQAATFEGGVEAADRLFGKSRGAIMGQFAIGGMPPGTKGIPIRLAVPTVIKVLSWWLAGRAWPHPFFAHSTRQPLYPISVLTPGEREKLRPLCGPSPQALGLNASF